MNKTVLEKTVKTVVIILWAAIIVFCILNADKITVDSITGMAPKNPITAILFLWFLFALKSFTVVVYCAVLDAATALLFPFYIALPVNLVGTAIMITIPYFSGRYLGNAAVVRLMEKYPKLRQVDSYRNKNDFLLSFCVRLLGFLPSDPLSMFFGAVGMEYKKYLLSSMLGMLAEVILFTLIGQSISSGNIPALIASVSAKLLLCVAAFLITRRKALSDNGNK